MKKSKELSKVLYRHQLSQPAPW